MLYRGIGGSALDAFCLRRQDSQYLDNLYESEEKIYSTATGTAIVIFNRLNFIAHFGIGQNLYLFFYFGEHLFIYNLYLKNVIWLCPVV